MSLSIDKTFRKEHAEFNEDDQPSFISTFILNIAITVPMLIIGFVISLIVPLTPHPTYGFGAETPASVSDYVTQVLQVNLYVVLLSLFILTLTSLTEYFRARFDIRAGYKKIGNFQVRRISVRDDYKILRLNNGQKLKIDDENKDFDKFAVGQILEIQRTASNKLLSYKILA